MMVATLLEPDLRRLQTALRAFRKRADAFEIRFDAFRTPPSPKRIRSLTKKPLVATVRRPPDGGSYRGSEEARLATLEAALRAGFDYVDLEAGITLPVDESHVVRSVHDLQRTPRAEEIIARGIILARNGAVFKFASRVASLTDTIQLLKASRALGRSGVRAAVMGLGDFPRAIGYLCGSQFVYGGARTSAPLQPKLEEIHATLEHWGSPAPRDDLYLVAGSPITQSLSPRIHNAAFRALGLNAAYGALEVKTGPDLDVLLREAPHLGLRGLSITMPLKEEAFGLSTKLTPEAKKAGAVNAVRLQDATVHGHNTDGIGAARVIRTLAKSLASDSTGLLIGTGGAARGILSSVHEIHLTLTGRRPERRRALADEFGVPSISLDQAQKTLFDYDLLINGTSVEQPVRLRGYRGGLFDLHYRPQPTAWQRHARAHRLPFVGGRDLLLHQGVAAFEFWTDRTAPTESMEKALEVPA